MQTHLFFLFLSIYIVTFYPSENYYGSLGYFPILQQWKYSPLKILL